ncbi:MAG: MBL fold metallo-hydrolase, partial [Blastocatellia bacterium]
VITRMSAAGPYGKKEKPMAANHLLNIDLAKVFETKAKKGFITILAWGDEIEVVGEPASDHVQIKATKYTLQKDGSVKPEKVPGFIVPPKGIKPADVVIRKKDSEILKIDFVDVQQGDGSVIETPDGKIILIDGGDTRMFARYLANRFRGTSDAKPKEIDCILVTHGDADHFLGLTEIHKSETDPRLATQAWKRLFIHPNRVYHNGLVKRPGMFNGKRLKDVEQLGATKTVKDPDTGKNTTIITGLETDLLKFPRSEMNEPFQQWQDALTTYRKRGAIKFRRLQRGDDAFDFLAEENISIQVLGPMPTKIGAVEGLRFLGNPPKGPRVGQEALQTDSKAFTGQSASHTINGHSVIFRLNYGSFNFLFTGDLNDEAGQVLARAHNTGEINLQSEVFKVPHHGSADFSGAFIQAVAPVISIVSSGDENARKEFIHPRATLMGSLGKYGRVEEPLVFVTELVAFFETIGSVTPERHKLKNGQVVLKDGTAVLNTKARKPFFAFNRAAFGIVMVRTDGKRLLVYTNSGQAKLKEAYGYEMDQFGKPRPTQVRQA